METIYFQPPDIDPKYCEAGVIPEGDSEYIWYLDEPCKCLISNVKIIPRERVIYDKKERIYMVQPETESKEAMEETLESAAERVSKTNSVYETAQDDFYQGFIAGAKWQSERMYNEQQVIAFAKHVLNGTKRKIVESYRRKLV